MLFRSVLEIASPELWNTENPYLYKLILETENEVIVDHIALRKIEIKDQVIYLNRQKIKFRGVNRHDSDPVTGFTISLEQITTDLTLMKQHNFNDIPYQSESGSFQRFQIPCGGNREPAAYGLT